MRADEFREARWLRAGATPKQLTVLRAKHRRRAVDARTVECTRIDGISDHDLRAELEPQDPVDPPDGELVDGGSGPDDGNSERNGDDSDDDSGDEGESGGE